MSYIPSDGAREMTENFARAEVYRLQKTRAEKDQQHWEQSLALAITSALILRAEPDEQVRFIGETQLKFVAEYIIQMFEQGEIRSLVIIGMLKELTDRRIITYSSISIAKVQRKFNIH